MKINPKLFCVYNFLQQHIVKSKYLGETIACTKLMVKVLLGLRDDTYTMYVV